MFHILFSLYGKIEQLLTLSSYMYRVFKHRPGKSRALFQSHRAKIICGLGDFSIGHKGQFCFWSKKWWYILTLLRNSWSKLKKFKFFVTGKNYFSIFLSSFLVSFTDSNEFEIKWHNFWNQTKRIPKTTAFLQK